MPDMGFSSCDGCEVWISRCLRVLDVVCSLERVWLRRAWLNPAGQLPCREGLLLLLSQHEGLSSSKGRPRQDSPPSVCAGPVRPISHETAHSRPEPISP